MRTDRAVDQRASAAVAEDAPVSSSPSPPSWPACTRRRCASTTGSAWSAPGRTPGGGRRYSPRDVELLREVQRLSQEDGVNLAGIKRIIELESQVEALQARVHELLEELDISESGRIAAEAAVSATYRRDLVPQRTPSSALVVWRPREIR